MFRSAATKIAHNSTLPSLGGNKELRPLQDLINLEKNCMTSMQHTSTEFGKSADALRTWGAGEGEDLGDTLTSCTFLLSAFSDALATYASAHNVIRASMKTIRTSEETLEEQKRRRKSLHAKADAAERKLSKMSPEHKSLQAQTDILNRLREDIRIVEGEILEGESRLWDEKRRSVKMWMNVKWTGMGELCEKGIEIPESYSQPGMTRVPYHGHQRTQMLVAEARRGIEGVGALGSNFTRPSIAQDTQSINQATQLPPLPLVYNGDELELRYVPQQQDDGPHSPHMSTMSPSHMDTRQHLANDTPPMTPHNYGPNTQPPFSYPMPAPQPSYPVSSPSLNSSFLSQPDHGLGSGHFIDVSDFSTTSSTISNDTVNAGSQRTASVDDFGVGMGGPTGSGPSGGRFATFPVKSKMGTSQPIVNEKPSNEGMLNPWNAEQELYNNNTDKRASMVSESSVGLAYDRSDYGTTVDEHGMDNKHVRFGAVSDVDEEMQKRLQQQQTPSQPNAFTSPTEQASLLSSSTSSSTEGPPRTSVDKTTGPASPKSPHEPPPAYQYPAASTTERAPSPPVDPVEAERELNAAAAREVSREFDSLTFKPPSVNEGGLGGPTSPPGRSSPASFNLASPSPYETAPPGGLERDLSASPLLPPNPAFAGRDRSVSPGIPSRRPTIDVNTINVQPATPMTSSFSPSHASPISASIGANPVVSSPKTELPPVPNEGLGIPGHHFEGGNDSRDDLSQRTASPAYRTPPEYHTPRLGSRSASGSVSAGGSPLPSPVPGTKTISAAAFRRPPPRKMSGDTLNSPPFAGGIGSNTISGGTGFVDTSPLVLKKRLPGSSPQPGFGGDRAASPVSSGIGGPRNASGSVSAGTGVPYSHSQLQHSQLPVEGEDDQYDYISAYVGSPGGPNETNSPRTDFGNLGRGNGGAPGSREGYDQGRFTTNLDEGLR